MLKNSNTSYASQTLISGIFRQRSEGWALRYATLPPLYSRFKALN